MTELQVTINNIKEMLIRGDILVTRLEKAQKDLEHPPPHKWEHGDVFMNTSDCQMILICCGGEDDKVFCLGPCTGHNSAANWLAHGKFLFNIKEKL